MKNKLLKNRKILYTVIALGLILFLTVGYSVLKSTLIINGNTTINKNSWIIYFDDVNIASDSAPNEDPAQDATITNYEKTNIEFTANLTKPGDFYEFTVYTVNDGSIDAAVSSIEKSVLSEEQQKYLTFEVKYDDGEEIKRCDILKANDRRLIKAVVKYKDGLDTSEYPSEGVNLTLFFKINYEQNTECEDVPSNKHKLTIYPSGGVYQGRSAPTRIYLEQNEEYTFTNPTRNLYNFKEWSVKTPEEGGTYTFVDNKFTMGEEDVEIEAIWIEGDYVARIMNTYYKTVQEAFNAAGDTWDDNTVYLIRNVSENPTNNTSTPFKFDLSGFTLTGSITNSKVGDIDLVNGTVKADIDHEEAFVNYGKLSLGEEGLPMLTENSIKLLGNTIGLRNIKTDDNIGEFYFYDGYIEGTVGIVGGYTDKEDKYFVFAEHVTEKGTQRVYLIKNPNRAVAKTTTEGEIYYYNLQDAINAAEQNKKIDPSLTDNDYVVYAIREFEAAYEISVDAGSRVFLDLGGYDVSLGETVTNDGYFKVTNSSDTNSKLRVSESITNNNNLVFDNITVVGTTDVDVVKNEGNLTLTKSTIQSKNGYGVYNENDGTINMDLSSVLTSTDKYGLYNSSDSFTLSNGTVYGLYNTGNTTITDNVKIHNANTNYAIENSGTITMTGGEVSDTKDKELIHNTGTFNANGGTISAKNTAIKDGTIVVNGGTVTSTNGPTINSLNVTVTSGIVTSTEGTAIYSEANSNNNGGKVTINGGTVSGKTYGINSNDITVNGGTISSDGTAIKDYTYTSGSKVIKGKTNITNGTITSTGDTVVSDNLTMSNGTISSTEGVGVTVNTNGVITGGSIQGETYGVYNKGILTLGNDDKNISSNNPSIQGGLYGLYSDGTEVNFYDGELIGGVDSHHGSITGTPSGGSIFETEVEIDGEIYQKEYVNSFEPWLQVGSELFNNLDDASTAVSDEGTITVTRDVDITFIQTVKGSDKNIILDLNGKTITSTQTIVNESILTIVDNSTSKTGAINPTRVEGITNNNSLTINGGSYNSSSNTSIINNKTMTINNANVKANSVAIVNNDNLTINDVNITETPIGINNGKTLLINDGTINTTNKAINNLDSAQSVTIEDGTITGTNYGLYGDYGNITIDGGDITSTNNNAISSYFGTITVNDGNITSTLASAVLTHNTTTVNGGTITGTTGIKNELYCPNKNSSSNCSYKNIIVNDGHIIGTTDNGIKMTGNSTTGKLFVYGGTIEGHIDGIDTTAEIQIGKDDGTIVTATPAIIGHTTYGLKTTAYTAFYDGTLKGIVDGYNGLINIIPVATLIGEDYEYINKEEYQTDFITNKANFLRVGTEEFNSINDAYNAIEGTEGTITVIKDAYIDFEQSIPSGKTVTFDLNGHSLVMTQPLKIQGNVTIVNAAESGGISNISSYSIENSGTTTIKAGTYSSNETVTIKNTGTLTIDGGTYESTKSYTIDSSGPLTINDGTITATNNEAIYSRNNTTINGGTITSNKVQTIYVYSNKLTVNGGTITSTVAQGISTSNNTTIEINDGEIIGKTYGITDYSAGSRLNINGGHIVGETQAGVYTCAVTNIMGGILEGNTYGLSTYGSNTATTLGSNDGVISIDEPVIKGETYGLYISEGTLNFYDGILEGITGRYQGIISAVADHAQIFDDEDVIDMKNYYTNYLIEETEIAVNTTTNIRYGNLQEAIDAAESGETVELLTNVPLYYELKVNKNSNVTLDLKGNDISSNKKISVSVPFNIVNTSDNEAVIKTSAAIDLFNNTSTLNINNVILKNNSTNYYTINNNGTLNITNSLIESANGIQNNNSLTTNNTNINASRIAINNVSTMDLTGGTIKGSSYSIYSNSNKAITVQGTTFNGQYYNNGTGTSNLTSAIVRGQIQNTTATMNFNTATITNGRITNTGTMSFTDSEYNIVVGSSSTSSPDKAITTSGTMTFNNSTININKTEIGNHSIGIQNSGTLTLENNTNLNMGLLNESYQYRAIQNTGNTTISDSNITVLGGSTSYGIYSNADSAKAIILTGKIDVRKATNAYGIYINTGTFEMGHYEGSGSSEANVSITDPLIYVQGDSRGIGIKRINGSINFYDGIIKASKYAKPETTSNVEYQYEVTTYVDEETGFEYALLEYMGNDYQGDTVALLNGVYYKTVQDAIDKCEAGYTITLLKSVSEDLVVPVGKVVSLNLNKHSITTQMINSGSINVYNGALQNFDETTVINYGTFIMGEDDGSVSSANIRIISETTTIVNEGTLVMYDGYIEGATAINGQINEVASFSRIRTEKDVQSEKKYLQSLSEDAIRNKETDLILTIDPASGKYEGSKEVKEVFLKFEDSYTLALPEKHACNFIGWEVSDPNVISGSGTEDDPYVVTFDIYDITLTAKWSVSEDAVAKIGEDYYFTLQEALDDAKEGDLIELFKDVTYDEPVINTKTVTLDLGGKTVTGEFINNGDIKILNGEINNPNGVGLTNNRVLQLGENDGEIQEEAIRIIGTDIGLEQNGKFNFYDGFLEGDVALNGRVDAVPKGYFLYNDHNIEKDCQRVYLIGNPENAVAIIKNGENTQYFFSLQDAIDTATLSGKEIYIAREFEATYALNIKENANIVINSSGFDWRIGNEFTNNGTLKMYDSNENRGSIVTARTLNNNGTLSIDNLSITENNTTNNTILNNGTLTISNSEIIAREGYAVYTNNNLVLQEGADLKSDKYALYNNQTELTINHGSVSGINSPKPLTIDGEDVVIDVYDKQSIYGINMNYANSKLTINNANINSYAYGIYVYGNASEVTITGGNFKSYNHTFHNRGIKNNVTIAGGTFESTNGYALYSYGYNNKSHQYNYTYFTADETKYNITGGRFIGKSSYTIYIDYDTNFNMSNAYIENNYTSNNYYAVYCGYYIKCTISDSEINTKESSGITNSSSTNEFNVINTVIKSTGQNSYGIKSNSEKGNLSGVTIYVPKTSTYGLYISDGVNYANRRKEYNLRNVDIYSGNVGIYVSGGSASYKLYVNVLSGKVYGGNYGVTLNAEGDIVSVGDNDKEYDIDSIYVRGGLYGVNTTNGTINFYNGKIGGVTNGHSVPYSDIRTKKELIEEGIVDDDNDKNVTYKTTNASSEPISEYAKAGNGYARITYLGETTESCENGTQYNFDYTGEEATFTPTCDGLYSLETWGAQGGTVKYSSTTVRGGYGGYSYGEINLNTTQTLYINVGGQGETSTAGRNVTAVGGYNGGGQGRGINSSYNVQVGGGGGATHIATASGLLSTLEDNKDSVLIVSGGGGGSNSITQGYYGAGGNAGGYKGQGGIDYINYGNNSYSSLGGTQFYGGYYSNYTVGIGSFGKGASNTYTSETYNGGAGAGWYGGGFFNTRNIGPGGGSGHISELLSNNKMYGFNIPTTPTNYVINYLSDKEAFLRVGSEVFNNMDDAIATIGETGTIEVIANAEVADAATIPDGKNITLDLKGFALTMSQPITNNGNFTIVNNGDKETGIIDNLVTNALINNANLTLDGVHIKSRKYSAIYAQSGTGNVNITDSTLEGVNTVDFRSNQNITISGGDIYGSTSAITFYNTKGATLTVNDDAIVRGGTYGIYDYYSNNYNSNNITINKGTITGTQYGVYLSGSYLTLNDGEIKSTVTSQNSSLASIYSNYTSNVITINGGKVTSNNTNAIFTNQSIVMNGGIITSGYRSGILLGSNTFTVTINGGEIHGKKYGIEEINSNNTVIIGDKEKEFSTEDPLVEGEDYGLYKTAGKSYFYNGRLRGHLYGYTDEFIEIRTSKEIEEDIEEFESSEDIKTFTTSRASESARTDYAKAGNGYARITYVNDGSNGTNTNITNSELVNDITCAYSSLIGDPVTFDYTGDVQSFKPTCAGTYSIEAWGAQGGSVNNNSIKGGKGGYTYGELDITTGDTLYVYVGESYKGYKEDYSYNGGGHGCYGTSGGDQYGNGGGATDIRLVNGDWDNFDSLKSRIMVAAGGGGSGNWSSGVIGGAGGGLVGLSGTNIKNGSANIVLAKGGSQTEGGLYAGGNPTRTGSTLEGKFGSGGYGAYTSTWIYYSGGGAGYYGGGAGGAVSSNVAAAAGGSSFISGYAGCDAIDESSTSDNIIHTNQPNHYSGYIFNNAVMKNGSEQITEPNGDTSTGHTGHGAAKITLLSSDSEIGTLEAEHTIKLHTNEGLINNDTLTYNDGDSLGDIPGPEVSNSELIFEGWYLDEEFTKKVSSETLVHSSSNLYAHFTYTTDFCSTMIGKTFNYDYTGNVQEFVARCDGTYKLEVWGAQGGNSSRVTGGYGGYSTGNIELDKDDKIYITVGGQGVGLSSTTGFLDGGYNGGGKGYANSTSYYTSAGGGATHISSIPGLLVDLEENKSTIIIVAGGGGGASMTSSSYTSTGGSGGGMTGGTGKTSYSSSSYANYQGTGGTQEEGGYAPSSKNDTIGSFGQGGSYGKTNWSYYAGGGGGYYGGGGNYNTYAGAGGGSGYIANENLTNKYMYGYNVPVSINGWVNNYLGGTDGFLEVNGTVYDSFIEAIDAIAGTGTINVVDNAVSQENVIIPVGKNVTLNLNDKEIKMTGSFTNNGNFTITDLGEDNVGIINNTKSDLIINNGNVTINGAKVKTVGTLINANSGTGTITVDGNANLLGENGVILKSAQTFNMEDGLIDVRNVGVNIQTQNVKVNVNGGTIKSINNTIYGSQNNQTITMTGGTLYSKNGSGIYNYNSSSNRKITITGGEINAAVYGIYAYYDTLAVSDVTINKLDGDAGGYGIYCTYSTCTFNDININAENGNGIGIYHTNQSRDYTINNVNIVSNGYGATGIYLFRTNTTMNNVSIRCTEDNSIGINNQSEYNSTLTLNNVNVEAANIGIYMNSSSSSTTYRMRLFYNSGSVLGKIYGIYQTNQYGIMNIGNSEEEMSTSNPYIEGGHYSIYKTGGTLNFYSGYLKGYIKGNPGTVDIIREGYEIYESTDGIQTYLLKNKSYNTDDVSEEPISEYAKLGNGYARITYKENIVPAEPVDEEFTLDTCDAEVGKVYDFDAIQDVQTFLASCPGKYKLEVWGAQGGTRNTSNTNNVSTNVGGRGGYSTGVLTLDEATELKIYVGSSGANGGYNGGGSSASGANGGGATDIRLTDSLYTRILVAGGGGGGNTSCTGGAGGGSSSGSCNCSYCGSTANQTSGYSFGYGGNSFSTGGSNNGSGAGGGGWYGGGGGYYQTTYAGSGGSGYAFTFNSSRPSGYNVDLKYQLTDTSLIAGNASMPAWDEEFNVVGNVGDGHARITFIEASNVYDEKYNVILNTPKGTLQRNKIIYNKGNRLGTLETPTLDEEYEFKGWYADSNYTKKVNENTIVNANIVLYAKIEYKNELCSSKINDSYDFDYTGGQQSFVAECPGKYQLEVWGAQGGNTTFTNYSNIGGYGGYTVGDVIINTNENINIVVGGQGQSITNTGSVSYGSTKGYNGGGLATYYSSTYIAAGGGGATHIATSTGLLMNLDGDRDSVLIVAGGGGGAFSRSNSVELSGDGGHGGGVTGGAGIAENCYNYGLGGSQTRGGSYKACAVQGSTTRNYSGNYYYGPSFGSGLRATSNYNQQYIYSGGGAGWYGGNGGYYGPGGGGSGYTRSDRLSNAAMYSFDSETMYEKNTSNIAYLIPLKESIYNKTQDRKYTNFQLAFNEADPDDEFELLDDTSISYDVVISDSTRVTIDLKGFNLSTNKTIENNGRVVITNSSNSDSYMLDSAQTAMINNNGVLYIDNVKMNTNIAIDNKITGNVILDNVDINSNSQGIINVGMMRIDNSYIYGGTYGIYNNTTKDNTIVNSTISSKSTAIYKYSTSKTTLEDTDVIGQITITKSNSTLNMTRGSIVGTISNAGSMSIDSVDISYVSGTNNNENMITNPGIMVLKDSNLFYTSKGYVNNYTMSAFNNTGTLTSTNNTFTTIYVYNNYKYRTLVALYNTGILNSTNDTFEVYHGATGYGVYNAGSNTSIVKGATIESHDNTTSYGIYGNGGNIRFETSEIKAYNATTGGGVYSNAGSTTLYNSTIRSYDNTTTSYGGYIPGGTLTIETGNVYAEGVNAYGLYITTGSLVLGIEDGRGTDAADVSTTNPYISAIGSETGIGVRMGDGSFSFYDGYIIGSTAPRPEGDITTATDKNYQVVTRVDAETGYSYCVLEFIK